MNNLPKSPTTVIEYKSMCGTYVHQSQQQPHTTSPTSSSSSLSSLSSLSPTNLTISNNNGTYGANISPTNSGSSTPHQHFHKKYLREQQTKHDVVSENGGCMNALTAEETMRQFQHHQQQQQHFIAPIINYSTFKPELKTDIIRIEPKIENDFDEYSNQSPYKISGYSTPQSYASSPISEHELNNNLNGTKYESSQKITVQNKGKHPNNLPYDPLLHTNSKPPYSFSCLIFMAIEDSPTKALPVKEIYSWITEHFPYFKTAPNGWKNSVRHNLSLNKSFQKVEKAAVNIHFIFLARSINLN